MHRIVCEGSCSLLQWTCKSRSSHARSCCFSGPERAGALTLDARCLDMCLLEGRMYCKSIAILRLCVCQEVLICLFDPLSVRKHQSTTKVK
eukprot:scaffold135908_cov19-Tisochrysis_lutea.AAC.1